MRMCSWALRFGLLDGRLVGAQRGSPEPIEIGAQLGEAVRVDTVDAAVAGGFVQHETGPLEDLQMLRDGRPADGQAASDLADGAGALGDALEDRPPGAISERRPP